MAKKKSIVDRISDTVTEIVDTASAAAAEALKPDPEAVAATTNEQVYMPEATDSAATPAPLFTRKMRGPAPMRANKRVAAARAKKTAARLNKAADQDAKAPKQGAKKTAPIKSAKRAPTKTARKLAPKKPAKKGKKSKR